MLEEDAQAVDVLQTHPVVTKRPGRSTEFAIGILFTAAAQALTHVTTRSLAWRC